MLSKKKRTKIGNLAPTTAPQADARAPRSIITKFKARTKKINAYNPFMSELICKGIKILKKVALNTTDRQQLTS